MNYGVKYNTLLSRIRSGQTLHQACKGTGTPSFQSALGRIRRNSDGIAAEYENALMVAKKLTT